MRIRAYNESRQATAGAHPVCFLSLLAWRGCTVRSAPTAAKCTMKAIELVGAVLASVFLVVGCTATHTTKSDASVSKDRQRYETPENGPFLEQFEADEHVRAAVLKVLAMHRFSKPCIVIRGQSGAVWFTADRLPEGKVEGFESFDRIFVGVAASGQVQGRIVAYVRGPSDWGLRGSLFGGNLRPEAAMMVKEIESALRERQL